ncbi:hypothetical protein T484DRAFT_2272352 [Baffinella frigidus]|nr:hypothetical protein T484DRAFT_2272352 [Cryptophyta sp. CCMP2293]
MPTPKDARELAEDETVSGGSLFAYKIPASLLGEVEGKGSNTPADKVEGRRLRLRAMFDSIDKDASGGLSISELEQALESLEVSATHEEIQIMFAQADWDGSGVVDFEEFSKLFDSLQAKETEQYWDRVIHDREDSVAGLGSRLFGQALRGLETARSTMDEKMDPFLQFRRVARTAFREQAAGRGVLSMPEALRAIKSLGAVGSDVEIAAMFVDADSWEDEDKNGVLDIAVFESVAIGVYMDGVGAKTVWARALSGLLQTAAGLIPGQSGSDVWERTTLASGFRVKRAGINPGAPGFVYPFHPHRSMQGETPHLIIAGDCADAAYVFKPRVHPPP